MSFPVSFLRLGLVVAALSMTASADDLSPANQMELDVIRSSSHDDLAKVNQACEDLRKSYLAALEKRKTALDAAGNAKGASVVAEAITSFQGGTYTEGVDPTGTSADPEVASLGKIYLKEHQKLLASVRDRTLAVWKKYRVDLAEFGARLSKDGKADDAKLVAKEIASADKTLGDLQKAAPNGLPESQGGWDGVWDVVYAHHFNRRLKIVQTSPTQLYIEAMSGWSPHSKYTATYDPEKGHFIAEHVEEEGAQREESYLLQSGRILMRHFHDKYPFEKPEAPAVATPVKNP